jgi:hypothetical protein
MKLVQHSGTRQLYKVKQTTLKAHSFVRSSLHPNQNQFRHCCPNSRSKPSCMDSETNTMNILAGNTIAGEENRKQKKTVRSAVASRNIRGDRHWKNKVSDVDPNRSDGGEEGHARNKSRETETKLKTTRIGRENQSSKYQGIACTPVPCHNQHCAHSTCLIKASVPRKQLLPQR